MDPRTEAYGALAECFREPTPESAHAVASGFLADVLSRVFSELGLTLDAHGLREVDAGGEVLDRLLTAYHTLFTVPTSRFVLPVESVFKEWRAGEGLGTGSGMIMGPPALDMLTRYRARGLEIPEEMKDYPDHLALLLEYGGILCEEATLADQREFVQSHMDHWVDALALDMESLSEIPFYAAVACALRAFVRAERHQLGLPEPARRVP